MPGEDSKLVEQVSVVRTMGAPPRVVVRVDGTPDGDVDHLYRTAGGPPPEGDAALCGQPLRTFGQGRREALCRACAEVAHREGDAAG